MNRPGWRWRRASARKAPPARISEACYSPFFGRHSCRSGRCGPLIDRKRRGSWHCGRWAGQDFNPTRSSPRSRGSHARRYSPADPSRAVPRRRIHPRAIHRRAIQRRNYRRPDDGPCRAFDGRDREDPGMVRPPPVRSFCPSEALAAPCSLWGSPNCKPLVSVRYCFSWEACH